VQVEAKNINPRAWDSNAPYRQRELEARSDKTYWKLLVPLFKGDVQSVSSNSEVIDVGCGLGFLTNSIASCVDKITGIDISSRSIEYAKGKFTKRNIEFFNISIIDFQKKNKNARYDICIANMVFHNIPDLYENFNAIRKLLNNGGYLIFSIPHPAFWYASRKFKISAFYRYYKEKNYKVPFRIKGHKEHPCKIDYFHRPLDWYSQLLKKNNFSIIELKEPYLDSTPRNKDKVRDILYFICRKT
jgi:2-polyprenyl-3-methyl-5-hydroxy-6-metoxy-1,4-benzoquinol methylase